MENFKNLFKCFKLMIGPIQTQCTLFLFFIFLKPPKCFYVLYKKTIFVQKINVEWNIDRIKMYHLQLKLLRTWRVSVLYIFPTLTAFLNFLKTFNKFKNSVAIEIGLSCLQQLMNSCFYFLITLSFNRTQSRVVTGLLTGHNTLRRHLHLLRLINSPLCRACGVKEETSAHILCECEALASLRHTRLGSFFLEPEDIKSMGLGAVWSFGRATRLLWFWYGAQRARFKGLGASGPRGPVPTCNSFIH